MKVTEVLQQAEIIYRSSYSNSFFVISKYIQGNKTSVSEQSIWIIVHLLPNPSLV